MKGPAKAGRHVLKPLRSFPQSPASAPQPRAPSLEPRGPSREVASPVMALPHRRAVGRDQFDQTRHQRKAIRMIGAGRRVARLAQATHITDGADRTPAIIVTLQGPGGASRLVDGSIQGEINLHVPFQNVEHRPGAAQSLNEGWIVCQCVGEDIPVARRCYGMPRNIRPEMSNGPRPGFPGDTGHTHRLRTP